MNHKDPKTNELLQAVGELKPLDQGIKLATALNLVLPTIEDRNRVMGVVHNGDPEYDGLRSDIETAINCASAENGSNTPDFILAEYLTSCLSAFDAAVNRREQWYGREDKGPGHD